MSTGNGMQIRLVYPALLALALCCATAHAQRAKNIERGHDVGDGQVRYDTPYHPKRVTQMEFHAPTPRHPYYEVVVPMGDWSEGSNATVTAVRYNGVDCESFYLFKDGFAHVQSGWITRKASFAPNVVLVARSLWHNQDQATVEVDISATGEEGTAKQITKTYHGSAPAIGGGPAGFRHYQTVVLEDRAGVARDAEPFECSIAAREEHAGDLENELRVFVVEEGTKRAAPINFQTFNPQVFPGTPPGTSNPNYLQHPSRSVDVVFLASVPANGARVYLFAYNHPGLEAHKPASTDLLVEGPSLGAVVENKYFRADLDQGSGQIASIQLKGRDERPVPLLTNHLSNAAHWNPDSFSDNGLWGHTFAWDPPDQTVVTTRGPILFRITNSGRMPASTPQVFASVTYSFYASVPYVKVSTVMEVRDPLNINALRNGELVLNADLVTHFVWEDKDGKLRSVRGLHGPNWQDEWTTRVDHDVPWLALTHEGQDFGIAELVQVSTAYNPLSGTPTVHRPAFYLYYHHFWGTPVTYFTRGWVYPFSDYQRGPIMIAAVGSTYLEEMAFMPFFLHKRGARYGEVQRANRQLKHPLVERWGR